MSDTSLYMLRLDLDQSRLFSMCRRHRLPRSSDTGYAVHSGLAAMFGADAPSTFSVRDASTRRRGTSSARTLEVLAYANLPLSELRERATLHADPEAFRILDWERAADKPMPGSWRAGQALGFEVRVCPIVRMSKAGAYARAGAEVDAFLAAAWKDPTGPKPDRDRIYCDWLVAAIERTEGARVRRSAIERFELRAVLRRTQGAERSAKAGLRKPDVTIRGELEVTDPRAFDQLLRRGLGRHRAFGFGMLLLHPPEARAC